MFATLYDHKGIQFLGKWWSDRASMLRARADELEIEPETRAILTVVANR